MTNFFDFIASINWKFNLLFTIFLFAATIPTLLYVAFKTKDNGSGLGFVGYYLVKLLRKLR